MKHDSRQLHTKEVAVESSCKRVASLGGDGLAIFDVSEEVDTEYSKHQAIDEEQNGHGEPVENAKQI